jgi:glycosyltransferase involved in cell wall biosynthesis
VTGKRLLLVADTLDGGLGAAVRAQATWFERDGWAVQVFDHVPERARDGLAMVRAAAALRHVARRFDAGVTHCHGLRSFVVARLVTSPAPFVTLHGSGPVPSDPPLNDATRRAGRRIVPRLAAGAFTATPDGQRAWRFLPHASPRLAGLREVPIPDGPPTFLWLGRLAEPKRPDVFVRAMAAIADTGARGLVVGDGPLRAEVEALVRSLGAPVDMLGERDDVAGLIAGSWAVGLFSTHEALSFAVQEAMWSGRAAVVSDRPGLRWLAGRDGFVVPDADAAAPAFRTLTDPEVARARGAASARSLRAILRPDDPWPAVASEYERRSHR